MNFCLAIGMTRMTFNLHNCDSYEIPLKVVILGDPSCGKTCFTTRYTQDEFSRQYIPTPGPSFHLKPLTVQNRGVKLILWDIGGRASEACSALIRTYVSSANIIIFIYDITSSQSFSSIPGWVDLYHLNRKGNTPSYVALVANKCDMEHQRVVTLERHAKLVHSLQMHPFAVSARTGDNVQSAFKFVCQKCVKDNIMKGFDDEEEFIKHSEWHIEQNIEAQNQLREEARVQQAAEDLRPKLFHCHHCQFVTSFNSSSEFVAHIEKEHTQTTIEENTIFIPQGKLKMKGYKAVPPEIENLNAQFAGAGAGGGWGGGGGYGGGNADGYGGFDGVLPGAGWGGGGGVIGGEGHEGQR